MRIWICLLAACFLQPCGAATVRTFSGQTVKGKLEFGPGTITLTPDGGAPVKINPAELAVLTVNEPKNSADLLSAGVLLIDGTLVGGGVKSLEAVTTKFGQAGIAIPEKSISALVFTTMQRGLLVELAASKVGAILPNEDFYEGEFVNVKQDKVIVNSVLFGPKRFQIKEKIWAVILRPTQHFPAVFEVSGKDGSRYLTSDLRFDAEGVVFREPILGEVKIKSGDLVEVRAGPGRFQAVTNLKPVNVEAPAGMDQAVAATFEPGSESSKPSITTAVNTAVTYTVPPGLTLLVSDVEVTKDTPMNAKVTFAVYGEGRLLFRSQARGPGDAAEPIKVPLGMVKTISLRVEPASTGASIGAGMWLSPSFVRQ